MVLSLFLLILLLPFFFFFFLAALEVCRTLVLQLGIEHGALTMKVQSPDRWCVCVCVCVCVRARAHSVMSDSSLTPWTVTAHKSPLSMGLA